MSGTSRPSGPTPAPGQVAASRRLAYVLRHDPGSVGISLDAHGWVPVDTLLAALARHGLTLTRAELTALVDAPGKRRFVFDDTATRVRAHQGHSVQVQLDLAPVAPPAVLFHGTTRDALDPIAESGLLARGRHHVHLSADVATAFEVGSRRRGPVAVLAVDAATMVADGHVFYRAGNGVWLTDRVPPQYLTLTAD